MHKAKSIIIDLLLLFIITVPAFFRILNSQYFSMHDDQHIVRLFLLDQGLKQGYLYPRWVDGLGFGFGYPLYNFYPPLIYYVAELFHLVGFSLIWSVKLTFILGFYLGAFGIYLLVKKFTNRLAGFLSATLYTYFFYHAVLIYVRGALAEFISLAILPFVFLTLHNLLGKPSLKRSIIFAATLALLILTHPLIALPSLIFIGFFCLFYFLRVQKKKEFVKYVFLGSLISLSLSAFFWLPSMAERKYTLTDKILTGELASYNLHYIYPQQFIYSPWGYGGSGVGLSDGMTFQLGKIHLTLAFLSLVLCCFYLIKNKKINYTIYYFLLTTFLLLFSIFMTTKYSSFIWDKIKYLWYLQFPWRFLTFVAIFISIAGGYSVYFLFRLIGRSTTLQRWSRAIVSSVIILATIVIYQKYFKPQRLINTSDKERTKFEEISWRISGTSYEFVPKDVKTKKSELNTTLLAIEKKDLPKKPYEIISGEANVSVVKNKFQDKSFLIDAKSPLNFRLNTYNFPVWKSYLNSKEIPINDKNDFKLITVQVPSGKYKLNFVFVDTPVRSLAGVLTFIGLISVALIALKKFKEVDG